MRAALRPQMIEYSDARLTNDIDSIAGKVKIPVEHERKTHSRCAQRNGEVIFR